MIPSAKPEIPLPESSQASSTPGDPSIRIHRLAALQVLRPSGESGVVITGLGAMGQGLLYQISITPGLRCVAVAELKLERASAFLRSLGLPFEIVHTRAQLVSAAERRVLALTDDGELAVQAPGARVLIESTDTIRESLAFCRKAQAEGLHLVMMNAEADLLFGPLLLANARRAGRIYTSCDGDQPGVVKRLVDEAILWGLQPVLLGNIKGFLDRSSDPVKIRPEAEKRNLNPRMCAAFTDGTKLNIEAALMANACGGLTDVIGMHGPRAHQVREVPELFDLPALRARGAPVVDYILGAEPDGGVFVVGYCDHPYQRQMLRYYKMGDGPFYTLVRPMHLCHVESMRCVFEALAGVSLMEPTHGLRTNVFARAKRALKAGDLLDGLGGHAAYGLIENCDPTALPVGLPVCLADGVRLRRDIAQDAPILLDDVTDDAQRTDFAAYRSQFPDMRTSAP
jgi:predicted homoserine dehydrogenase-like protein